RLPRPAGLARLVRMHDLRGDAASVVDRDALLLCPATDVGGALPVVRGTATARDASTPAPLARLLHVRRKRLTKLVRVFRPQIDFVHNAIERKTHRLVGRLAIDVIEEPDDRFLCHLISPAVSPQAGQSSGLASG